MRVIEISDPELAWCLEECEFPLLYSRDEDDRTIFAFERTLEFDDVFFAIDFDEGISVVRTYESDDGAQAEEGEPQ